MKAPFSVGNKDNFDMVNSNSEWKDLEEEGMIKSNMMLRRDSVQEVFNGYYYDEQYQQVYSKIGSNLSTTHSRNTTGNKKENN